MENKRMLRWLVQSVLVGILAGCSSSETGELDEDLQKRKRESMNQSQIVARGITNERVLEALNAVERHRFVPSHMQSWAYADQPLPIGHDQTISQPYIVAFMTDALQPEPDDRVLEIGTGSGYQAAVLAELVDEVYTIEIVEPLGQNARRLLLDELGYENVHVRIGDGYAGWPEAAPFDKIMLTAAPPRIPQPLIDQLRIGGIMVAPVGTTSQELQVLVKTERGLEMDTVLNVRFVPMTGQIQSN